MTSYPFVANPANLDITAKSNGHLQCDECSTYWCIHVEQAVKEGWDTEVLWAHYPDPTSVEVPIIPTSNLWATVELKKPLTAQAQLYKAYYVAEPNVQGLFIGTIYPTEARATLRTMIVDWFNGTQPETYDCTSKAHGWQQMQRLDKAKTSPGLDFAQRWSIAKTGKCLGCIYSADPDLVPDPSAAPASPWK